MPLVISVVETYTVSTLDYDVVFQLFVWSNLSRFCAAQINVFALQRVSLSILRSKQKVGWSPGYHQERDKAVWDDGVPKALIRS